MSDRIGNLIARMRQPIAVAMVVLSAMVVSHRARAQATTEPALFEQGAPAQPAPEQTAPAPPPDPAPPKENPGLINEIGKLLEKPASMLPTLKSPREIGRAHV